MSLADKEPKTERLTIRCTLAQLERWHMASEACRRELTDWIRLRLDDSATADLEAAAANSPSLKRPGSQ
jgi:hypothetical protein